MVKLAFSILGDGGVVEEMEECSVLEYEEEGENLGLSLGGPIPGSFFVG